MLKLEIENSYKKDLKLAIKQNLLTQEISDRLKFAIDTLQIPKPLEKEYNPHPLSGDYKGYFDCHIKGDFVLVYKLSDTALHLVRVGRHTTIFKKY